MYNGRHLHNSTALLDGTVRCTEVLKAQLTGCQMIRVGSGAPAEIKFQLLIRILGSRN